MVIALVVVSCLMVVVGLNFISQATLGVGFIAVAVWFAALARIAQAAKHHQSGRAAGEATS